MVEVVCVLARFTHSKKAFFTLILSIDCTHSTKNVYVFCINVTKWYTFVKQYYKFKSTINIIYKRYEYINALQNILCSEYMIRNLVMNK